MFYKERNGIAYIIHKAKRITCITSGDVYVCDWWRLRYPGNSYCPLSSRQIIARQQKAESDRLSFTNMMHYVKDYDKSVHRDETHYISGHMLAWITKLSVI